MAVRIAFIGADEGLLALVVEATPRLPAFSSSSFERPSDAWKAFREGDGPPDLLVIGPNEPSALAVAERAVSTHQIQPVIVCAYGATFSKLAADISRSLFLGNAAIASSLDVPEEFGLLLSSTLASVVSRKRHRRVSSASEARLAAASLPSASKRMHYVDDLWRHAPIGLMVVDIATGQVLDHNAKAISLLGLGPEFAAMAPNAFFACFPEEHQATLARLLAEPPDSPKPHALVLWRASGEMVFIEILAASAGDAGRRLVILQDVTARAQAEEELRRKLALIEEQKAQIDLLSTPILRVWTQVILVPIVGFLDASRSARMVDAVLLEVSRSSAKYVILDLTGTPSMDDTAASGLLSTIRSTKLLGAACLVSGMSSDLARSVVDLGLDLQGVMTFPSLFVALRFVLKGRSQPFSA